jgi:hypothetical protein
MALAPPGCDRYNPPSTKPNDLALEGRPEGIDFAPVNGVAKDGVTVASWNEETGVEGAAKA